LWERPTRSARRVRGVSTQDFKKTQTKKMKKLKKFQKLLRASQTDAEQFLWYHLRGRRFGGYKFRRQHLIRGYIVDFVCLGEKLIIELDGGQHSMRISYDNDRTLKLQDDGFRVLRFWNQQMFTETESVLETIFQALSFKLSVSSFKP
jgi:very-short-patch-repair endonuclease